MNTPGLVRLNLFDLKGRIVHSTDLGSLEIGNHKVIFDGSQLASNIYFLRLSKLTDQNSVFSNGIPITILK